MNDLKKFRKYAAEKSAYNKSFVGYFLKQYQDKEKLAIDELMLHLDIKDLADYYRLCICKVENIDKVITNNELGFDKIALKKMIKTN